VNILPPPADASVFPRQTNSASRNSWSWYGAVGMRQGKPRRVGPYGGTVYGTLSRCKELKNPIDTLETLEVLLRLQSRTGQRSPNKNLRLPVHIR
jgi:hypothetical protein